SGSRRSSSCRFGEIATGDEVVVVEAHEGGARLVEVAGAKLRAAVEPQRLVDEARVGERLGRGQRLSERFDRVGEAAARLELPAEQVVEQRALGIGVDQLVEREQIERGVAIARRRGEKA